jgi:hypothetical protein
MDDTRPDVEVSRQRLKDLRESSARVLRDAHRTSGDSRSRLRPLIGALRQSLRWAAFKVEMLGIATVAHRNEAREELEVVLAVADQNRVTVLRLLQSLHDRKKSG